jgi:hypothetical protein
MFWASWQQLMPNPLNNSGIAGNHRWGVITDFFKIKRFIRHAD